MKALANRTPWQIQLDVIRALLVREMKTRFGRWRLGYAWVLLEPAMHILLFAYLISLIGRELYPGLHTMLFMLGGIAPFLFFSHCFSKSLAAVESNKGLFNYRQLRPFDAVLARVVLEFFIYIFSVVALLSILAWFGVAAPFNDFLLLVVVSFLYLCFCFGVSLAICVVGAKYPEAGKFGPMIQRPLYFMSGVFFSLEQIPKEYHPYLIWNPLLHVVELTREGLFLPYKANYASLEYLAFCAVAMLSFGLLVYRSQWQDLVRSQ